MIEDIYEETQNFDFGKAFKSLQRSEYMGRKGLRSYSGDRMKEIDVPTLIVHGAHDRTIPLANAYKAHELIANSELYVMDEARHWPQKEYPKEFARIVKEFLSKNDV